MRYADAAARLARLPAVLPPPADVMLPVALSGPERRTRELPPPGRGGRQAAVLVLVYPDEAGEARLILIERPSYDGHHSGEISLPGGKTEPGDADAVATALREAAEEVALDPDAVDLRVVGQLSPLWIPVSDFAVTPVVAVAARRPTLVAAPAEVAAILEPSVATFLPDAPYEVIERTIDRWSLRYGHYVVDGRSVWGATARVLSQLGAVLAG